MALEIEHKFLLKNDQWRNSISNSFEYKQGYLISDDQRSVRVRLSGSQAWLNIKSATIGSQRLEYEYEIPKEEGLEILESLCLKPLVEKTRYLVPYQQHTWEIDVFKGENEGLIVAEIELSEPNEDFALPEWVGIEVTEDIRYYNNNLSQHPYKHWNT